MINTAQTWWFLKRVDLTRGLLICGALIVTGNLVVVSIMGDRFSWGSIVVEVICMGVIHLLYMTVAHLLFTFGWIADMLFNRSDEPVIREKLFNHIYWFLVLLLPLPLLSYMMFVIALMVRFPDMN